MSIATRGKIPKGQHENEQQAIRAHDLRRANGRVQRLLSFWQSAPVNLGADILSIPLRHQFKNGNFDLGMLTEDSRVRNVNR